VRPEILIRPDLEFGPALHRLSLDLGCDVYDAAFACFVALLYRHIQQSVVTIGIVVPVRGSLSGMPTAQESRPQVVSCAISDDATLRDIATSLSRDRGVLGDLPADLAAVNAIFTVADPSVGTAHPSQNYAPLALTLLDSGAEIGLRLEFDGHSFHSDRMQELLAQYQLLVVQAARAPSSHLLDYSLITALGRSLLPDAGASIGKPRYSLLSEAFLACAMQRPNAVAVSQAGQSWTYAELDRSSQLLAAELRRRGIGAGDVVAVFGSRSFAVVSSMLGVFRSAAVLLNLDPKLPLERRKVMMRQAQVKCLICVGQSTEPDVGVPVIQVDAVSGALMGADEEGAGAPLPVLERSSPAYIFFTSGSSGTPKAVMGSHEGIAHFLDWQRRTFDVDHNDRAAHITALSFDAVLRDAFLVLTTGGIVCIPADADILDPLAIFNWMQSQRITLLHVVPSLMRAWLNHMPAGVTLSSLRCVFFSGEPLTEVLLRRFRDAFGHSATIVNLYGPTETTMVKCYHLVGTLEPGVQPIGIPMPETQVLILNRRGHLCGLYETGEIVIRTPFRTLGYFNDPEATARAFVPNPFRQDPDDLVYRTGDNGRYRTDGLLEIAGRIDNQVKIRGIRVEPGEIENTLSHHPLVREVAVVDFEDATGKYLAAYVVLGKISSSSKPMSHIDEIRQFLRARLPDHMVPAAFVILEALPLNANGKVNKAALPVPDHCLPAPEDDDGPATPLERQLVAVWTSALGRSHAGVNDSFGALGGDSLSSIGALMAMKRLGIPDQVARGIFDGLTIRQIAGQGMQAGAADGKAGAQWGYADAPILIRALSITLVVAGHVGFVDVMGNIKALLIVSGLSFAKFQLKSIEKERSIRPIGLFMLRIALPAFIFTVLMQIVVFHSIRFQSWLFIDNLIDPNLTNATPWFIDLLLQNIAIMSIPLAFRPVREFAAKNAYLYGMVFLGMSWISCLIVPLLWNTDYLYNRVPQILLWLMAFGWCAAYSDTNKKRIVSSVVFLFCNALNFEWFGWYPLIAGLAITWLKQFPVPMPRIAITAINTIAGASLFIYLTHMQFNSVLHKLLPNAPPIASVLFASAGGVIVWKAWDFASRSALVRLRKYKAVTPTGAARLH